MADELSQRTPPPLAQGRRYVTGIDAAGRSCVTDIGEVPTSARLNVGGAEAHDFWVVPRLPAPLQESANPPEGWTLANEAPRGGVIGRFITWAAGYQYPMHTTPTLDFIIILSGHLELGLESQTQLVGPGDVVVQRGTAHSWRNPGPAPCTFVAVLIDAAHA